MYNNKNRIFLYVPLNRTQEKNKKEAKDNGHSMKSGNIYTIKISSRCIIIRYKIARLSIVINILFLKLMLHISFYNGKTKEVW